MRYDRWRGDAPIVAAVVTPTPTRVGDSGPTAVDNGGRVGRVVAHPVPEERQRGGGSS